MAAADSSPLHIVIFPWLAFGHLVPGLELAERLAERGHRVSFVSTTGILGRLRPVAPALASLVDVVALPFPRVDGLPDGAEATSDLPPGTADLHIHALDLLAPAFSAFLDAACADGSDRKVDWLLMDNFHAAMADVATEHKVPCILNMPYSAATTEDFGHPDLSKVPPMFRRFAEAFEKCKLVAARSSFELEPESLPLMPKILGKPVLPLGLLSPAPPPAGGGGAGNNNTQRDDDDSGALSWLDAQPPKSVLYVAFGSEYPMTLRQLHEIALGLELAGTRFLWALKKPKGVVVGPDDDGGGVLPPGFEERTRGRGAVVTGWVPQTSILGHGAVAAFMMHCGWGSTIEALQYGHPLVMMPVMVDHLSTARAMTELRKVGVRVRKEKNDEAFLGDNIADAIRAVMCDEESKRVFVANAKKMQEIVADDECQQRYIDEFVKSLRTYKLELKQQGEAAYKII